MDARLDFNKQTSDRFEREPSGSEGSISLSEIVEQLRGFVRRQFPIFIFVIACTIALGLVYLLTTPASYTSHAMLLIDSSKLRVLQQQDAPLGRHSDRYCSGGDASRDPQSPRISVYPSSRI